MYTFNPCSDYRDYLSEIKTSMVKVGTLSCGGQLAFPSFPGCA